VTDDIARSTVARGNNLVRYGPPSPAAAGPVLQGISEGDRVFLGLVPVDALGEWARVAGHLAGSSSRIAATTSPDRLARLLGTSPGLTLTSPETALESLRRSGLKLGGVGGVLMVWPERWAEAGDQLTTLLQDIPKEAQRVIISSDSRSAATLVERHAWRAAVSDTLGPLGEPAPVAVRTVPVSWTNRIEALNGLVEQLDPAGLVVWTASDLDHPSIRAKLATSAVEVSVLSGTPAPAPIIVAYDLPSPGQFRELEEAGEVVLLLPPGTERYAALLASTRKPLHLSGALEQARSDAERTRQEILQLLGSGVPAAELELLAPIFERYEATVVAAALLRLWQQGRASAPGEAPGKREETVGRIWASAGKRDGVTPNDLVAVLARECEVPREAIGRIEIRDSFSLIEIAKSAGPEQVAERLTGKTVRKRRLVARLDRPSAPLVQRVAKRLPRPKHRGGA
jgi:hypothetical protein